MVWGGLGVRVEDLMAHSERDSWLFNGLGRDLGLPIGLEGGALWGLGF